MYNGSYTFFIVIIDIKTVLVIIIIFFVVICFIVVILFIFINIVIVIFFIFAFVILITSGDSLDVSQTLLCSGILTGNDGNGLDTTSAYHFLSITVVSSFNSYG